MPFQNTATGEFGIDALVLGKTLGCGVSDLYNIAGKTMGYAEYAASPPPAVAYGLQAYEVAPVDGVQQWATRPDPAVTVAIAQSAKLAALADARWTASQTFGYAGLAAVACDDTANGRLTSTIAALQLPGVPAGVTVNWSLTPTIFKTWALADLQAFGLAMMQHVQACWANQAALTAQITAAATVSAVQAVDVTQGWPA